MDTTPLGSVSAASARSALAQKHKAAQTRGSASPGGAGGGGGGGSSSSSLSRLFVGGLPSDSDARHNAHNTTRSDVQSGAHFAHKLN